MKPTWDKLMKEYKDHASILIADVDCEGAGKDLCETHGVDGFPTLKYGDPSNLEDYEHERDLKTLKKFAKTSLGPRCGATNLDLCDSEKKTLIEEWLGLPMAKLSDLLDEKKQLSNSIDEEYKTTSERLEKEMEEAEEMQKNAKRELKESGMGLMASVHSHRLLRGDKVEKTEL